MASQFALMNKFFSLFFLITGFGYAQTINEYEISFENAVHHEANVTEIFRNVSDDVLEVRMSRSIAWQIFPS